MTSHKSTNDFTDDVILSENHMKELAQAVLFSYKFGFKMKTSLNQSHRLYKNQVDIVFFLIYTWFVEFFNMKSIN